MGTVTTARSTGTWQEDCRKKKADDAQKQKNVGVVYQSSVQSISSTASVGAVALINSATAGSGLGRLVIGDFWPGRENGLFSGPWWNQAWDCCNDGCWFWKRSAHSSCDFSLRMLNNLTKPRFVCRDVQGNKLKVYGTALLNYGVHDVGGNVKWDWYNVFWLVTLWNLFFQWANWVAMSGIQSWEPCRVCHMKLDVKFLWRARETLSICQLVWDFLRWDTLEKWWRWLLRKVQRLRHLDVNWEAQVPPEYCFLRSL